MPNKLSENRRVEDDLFYVDEEGYLRKAKRRAQENLGCGWWIIVVVVVIGGLAWGLHLTGLSDAMWPPLFWLRWIPTTIIAIGILVFVVGKLRK